MKGVRNISTKIIQHFLLLTIVFPLAFVALFSCSDHEPGFHGFSTNGHTAYHIRPVTVPGEDRCVAIASLNGTVACFTSEGKPVWEASLNGEFPFDMAVKDIDNDGFEETFVATGNGKLYAISHTGDILWSFSQQAPLYQVTVAAVPEGGFRIFTGGVSEILYSLDIEGNLVGSTKLEHCIRHLGSGNIFGDGDDYVSVATASSGFIGRLGLHLFSADSLKYIWSVNDLGDFLNNSGKRFFSMTITDVDNDGCDDILLSHGWGENGRISAYNHKGSLIYSKSDNAIPAVPYRMNLLRIVELKDEKYILGHFGFYTIIYNLDGTLRKIHTADLSMADSYFDKKNSTHYLASSVSGGDGVYSLKVNSIDDFKGFTSLKPVGLLEEIVANYDTLNKQIERFVAPAYQPKPKPVDVFSHKPAGKTYENVHFIRTRTVSQIIDDPDAVWCRHTDKRRRFDLTADEIVEMVADFERKGEDVVFWAGHGAGVFYPLETFERMIKAGPNHLRGFVLAEMEKVDQVMVDLVKGVLLPLAELCLENDKKIYFRNKNIFWNGTCYMPFWRDIILNKKYSSVFVPGLEETNCRTQDLSLAGRIGLWQSGYFDQWSCRTVTDNANFDRMFEWGGQLYPSHHFRHMVSRAFYGADVYLTDIHQGEQNPSVWRRIAPFYDMLEKGIISIPDRDDILSVSNAKIAMNSQLSQGFLDHGKNGHDYWFPEKGEQKMVFNRMDAYWGGSSLPEYDFSKYAYNVTRRTTNFLPENPWGIVPIVPQNNEDSFQIVTNGEFYFDGSQELDPEDYSPIAKSIIIAQAEMLPVRVSGEVHWSAVRLDPTHIRVLVMDPGYLSPGKRNAAIKLQTIKGISVTDILSRESLNLENGEVHLTVPAGLFRIIDIEHLN